MVPDIYARVDWPAMPQEQLVEFVRESYPEKFVRNGAPTGAHKLHEAPPAELGLEQFARDTLGPYVPEIMELRWWASRFSKRSQTDKLRQWMAGFPHSHGWKNGMTMVIMVQPAEQGGETVVCPDDGEPDEFALQAGECVLIGGQLEHGVRPMAGNTERLVMIVTAFAPEE